MWNPLAIFGSRVVEAISAVESLASTAPVVPTSVAPGPAAALMEGQDANALITSRLGVEPGDVTAKLVALSQQNKLNGAADGMVYDVDDDGAHAHAHAHVNVSLTLRDLEEFERYEEEAAAEKLAPAVVLKMRPAVLGATPTRTAPAAVAVAHAAETSTSHSAADADAAEVKEVVKSPSPPSQSAPAPTAPWCEDEVEMEPEEDRASTTVQCIVAEPSAAKEHEESDAWPERKRYAEAVEAEDILMGISQIEVPLLERDDLTLADLQHVVTDVVVQVNKAHTALATAGHTTAERSREALQQARIAGDLATEALLKAYEVSAVAASCSRQSWKMCVVMGGPHMPPRLKGAERKLETTGRYLAYKLFGVNIKMEELAICHFRGQSSSDFILKFTRTGNGSSHEDLLRASKAMGRKRSHQVYAKIPQADVDMEIYFLLRCMVKAGEAENTYTARSGRPAAWLKPLQGSGEVAPYTFGDVMEVRALMGPKSRKEEARKVEENKISRRKRALCREAVGYGLREVIREAGMAEDIVRDEAMEKGVPGIPGGGIRRMDKADLAIARGINMDSLPAWAEHGRGRGRGRGRGDRGSKPARGGAQGVRGARGGFGSRGGGGRGDAGRYRGRGGRGGRGRGKANDLEMTGGNSEAVPDRKGKRKITEENIADEAKKVKLTDLTSEPPAPSSSSSGPPLPAISANSAATPSPSTSGTAQAQKGGKKKSLLGQLLTDGKVDAGRGFGLFD
jgi:hypothetical protein